MTEFVRSERKRLAASIKRVVRVEAGRIAAAPWMSRMTTLAAHLQIALREWRKTVAHQWHARLQVWVDSGVLCGRKDEGLLVGYVLRLQNDLAIQHAVDILLEP